MFTCWNSFIIPTCQLKVDWALLYNTFTGPSGQLNQSNRSDLVADVDHGVLCLTTLSSSVHNIPGYFRIQNYFIHPTQMAFRKQNTFWRPQPEVCFSAWQVGLLPARSWLWPKLFPTKTIFFNLTVGEPIYVCVTWYWLESVLEDDGMLAPLTGVPAVKQDMDIITAF